MEEEEQAGCPDRAAGKDAEGQQDIWESGCSVCGSSAGIHSWFHSVINGIRRYRLYMQSDRMPDSCHLLYTIETEMGRGCRWKEKILKVNKK